MLVLSRKRGEQISIGDSITVTVISVNGNRVRLGIEAPGETPVRRQEVVIEVDRDTARELQEQNDRPRSCLATAEN